MKKPFFASTQKIFSKLPLKQEDFEVPSVNQKDLEHKCRMLVQYMDQPVIVTDKNERTIYANPRLCQLLECTLSEILGKKSYDFCTKDTSKMVRYVTSTDRKSGVISSYEVSLLSKTKKKIPVRVHGIPLDDGGTVGIFYDLRQLKEKEQQAEMQKMYFEQLFANDSEGIIVLDDQDHILNINPAFTDLFGFALKEIRGKILNDTIVPNHLKK